VAFIGGFLLGSLLTGGVFGTYFLFGSSRYREAEMMAHTPGIDCSTSSRRPYANPDPDP